MMIGQKTLRPTVVSVYNYVQPLVSVTVSVIVGLAVFKGMQAIAAILIFSGVWLVVKSKSKHDIDQHDHSLAYEKKASLKDLMSIYKTETVPHLR